MTGSGKVRKQSRVRLLFQLAAAALLNGYAAGFAGGKIFTGSSKLLCVPVLNCYSCPGALGACPIGAIQAVAGGVKHDFSFYVLGTLMLFGTLLGRLVCGFVCPFGLVQDLLHRIPGRKLQVPEGIDKPARYLKYLIFVVCLLILPVFVTNAFGTAAPYFCKYFCPAGTLEGGIPLLLKNESLRAVAGALFQWKLLVLILIVTGSIFVSRFFCRYFCPLGAFYGLFQRFSIYHMNLDQEKCVGCGQCEKVCPMKVKLPVAGRASLRTPHPGYGARPQETAPGRTAGATRKAALRIVSAECIRCGKCKAVCPTRAITSGYRQQEQPHV